MQKRYYRLPENPSSFVEDLQSASESVPEPDQQDREMEVQRMQMLEAQKNAERRERVKNLAKDAAKKKIKQEAVKQGERLAARGFVSVATATSPYWAPVLAVILGILGFIALLIVFIVSMQDFCATEGVKGFAIRAISRTAGQMGYGDLCTQLSYNASPGAARAVSNVQPNDPTALSDADARILLASAGIPVNAREPQTSLKGIKRSVVIEIINLANACSSLPDKNTCRVIVTGGTELTGGHADGPCSHLSGNKIDIDDNREINQYIFNPANGFATAGTRGDGAQLYRSPAGVIYALESNHWDIVVGC